MHLEGAQTLEILSDGAQKRASQRPSAYPHACLFLLQCYVIYMFCLAEGRVRQTVWQSRSFVSASAVLEKEKTLTPKKLGYTMPGKLVQTRITIGCCLYMQ